MSDETDAIYSNEMVLDIVRVGNVFVSRADIEKYARRLSQEQKRVLTMGPRIAFIAEMTPYVRRIDLSLMGKLLGLDDRVISRREPDLSGQDYRAVKELEMIGLVKSNGRQPRYEREVFARPEDRQDVDAFRPDARGYAVEESWVWTEKGKAVAGMLA